MPTSNVRLESNPALLLRPLRTLARRLVASMLALLAVTAAGVQAQSSATFTLQDKTNLTPGTYQIYVTGFSTAGPFVLQSSPQQTLGAWITPAVPPPGTTATLPCYRFPQDITQIPIDGNLNSISARVYYFVVTDTTLFPSCNPTIRSLGTCTGVTATSTGITMASGATIPPGGCTIVVPVTVSAQSAVTNATGTLQTGGGSAPSASATLAVIPALGIGPTLAKAIAPSIIAAGGGATLTLTLGNPGATALTLSSAFTDTMPAGVTTTGSLSGTCPGATMTTTTITMANGAAIPPGGCTIVASITSSTPGTAVSTTGALQTTGGTAPPASAPLAVSSGSGPIVAKAIAPSTIAVGGSATLTLALGNPGATPLTLSSAFTDTMPAWVATAGGNTGTCAGVTVTAATITMANGSTIPPGGCTIVVPITATRSGMVTNATGALQTGGGTAPPASAPLTVVAVPTLSNTIAPATAAVGGGNPQLTLTLGNSGPTPLTLTSAFTNPMPAGVTTTGSVSGTCPGATMTATMVTMASGSTIPPGGCTIVVAITSSTPGTVTNTTGTLQSSGGSVPPASAPLTMVSALGSGPTLTKAFAPAAAVDGGGAMLTITLGNPGATALTLTSAFTDTMPAGVTITGSGLFNAPSGFTYTTTGPMNLSEPPVSAVGAKSFPAWTYSEIGASATNGTIDLSQVDFVSFPMNTTATVLSGNPSVMGNPVGQTANPGEVVNHNSMRDSFRSFIDALAVAASNKTCAVDSTPTACAYLDLLQDITTAGSAVPQYVIQNPGGYLAQYTAASQASRLNTVFDGIISKLWSTTSAPTLVINTGGALGSVPQDTFTSAIVTIDYPGVTPAYPVTAMKFTGTATSGNYVAYIVSPADYQAGCGSGKIPGCGNPTSTGYQVFAGAGVFGTPSYGSADQQQVVARLGFLISGAMNRGVALVTCTNPQTWQCWQDETYWYPTKSSPSDPTSIYPDITQNLFSQWMHTATIGGTPMFVRPPSAVKAASGTPGAGKLQGMAYGFSNDENPTPQATTLPQPEVPSKFDGTVVYGPGSPAYTITFGPWVSQPATNPTLTVTAQGTGTVTSSPAGINCGSTCSASYASGTQVTLTAAPGTSAIFGGWSGGGCTGRTLTCTVVMSDTTAVTAAFWSIEALPPLAFGLHAVVSGNGTVTSAPSGISCGSECSKAFSANAVVTLSAVAGAGSAFAGWSGACSGTSAVCAVTMTGARTVGATFVSGGQYTLSVGSGAGGIVTTVPGAIDCGTRCIAGFAAGAEVSVVAHPDHGYRFAGWSGACSGTSTCDLTMNAGKAVQATFAPVAPGQFVLTVHDFGEGAIVSLPGGIDCGNACSAAFAAGTEVTLLATPAAGYRFAGWSGGCTGTDACVVWMDNLANVNALFTLIPVPVAAEPIPTLAEWAMVLMSLLVLGIGCLRLRARPLR